jgi:hypothetical protein
VAKFREPAGCFAAVGFDEFAEDACRQLASRCGLFCRLSGIGRYVGRVGLRWTTDAAATPSSRYFDFATVNQTLRRFLVGACFALASCGSARALDLTFEITSPGSFTSNQIAIVQQALGRVEGMWETMLIGYQPGINVGPVPITIQPTTVGLASASYSSTTFHDGYTIATSGFVNINTLQIEPFANWQGDEPNGLNFIDELLAHEVGHVLGIGTLWMSNNVYSFNTFQYTGPHGLAAYKSEFNQTIAYVPVENAGNPGTPNAHWDQLMRSSPQEGNPSDPWPLDPRVGVVDQYGRDRGLELMTGAIDPDFREPFVSRFTIQSMRDMGYAVTEFEDFNGDGLINVADRAIVLTNQGMTGLQIDSMRFGDANRDRKVDMADFTLWQSAAPEPASGALAGLAALYLLSWRRCRHR